MSTHTDNVSDRYAVVYQFGKVASTSIVSTLNHLPDIEAVQCHFMGERALADILPTITGPDVTQYFFQHQLGQFIDNLRITRRVNIIRSGGSSRLLLVSLTRDPLEWFRSSLVQDMEGYLPILTPFAKNNGIDAQDEAETVQAALELLFTHAAHLLQANGGVDACLDRMNRQGPAIFDKTLFQGNVQTQRIFRMSLRPFDWFEKHFQVALGIGLDQMTNTELGLEYSDARGDYVILRYEDAETTLKTYLNKIGAPSYDALKRENESSAKLHADAVSGAIRGPAGRKLAPLFKNTRYSQTFGYDCGVAEAAAS